MLGEPSANTARLRTPVVPASRAITQRAFPARIPAGFAVGVTVGECSRPSRQRPGSRTIRACASGILTGGGDCPGLNAVIRAAVRIGERVHGDEMIGFLDAWDGVLERRTIDLTVESMRGTLPKGGTVLGTRRGSPFDVAGGVERVEASFADLGLDALIVIGGNGSLSVACRLQQERGLPIVGVPKTIDNDVVGTDVTFGFNTAVQIATDAIDRLHTTAESHDRVMVVEVMGRETRLDRHVRRESPAVRPRC